MRRLFLLIFLIVLFHACDNNNGFVPELDPGSFIVAEDTQSGKVIGTITIVDQGSHPIQEISLEGAGDDLFEVNPTGVLTLKDGASLDFEQTNSYHLSAFAVNNYGQSEAVDIDITVTDYLNPFLTAIIPAGDSSYIKAVAISDGYCAASVMPGKVPDHVKVYRTESDGSFDEIAHLTADEEDFGGLLAMDGPYLVVGTELEQFVYLYKRTGQDSVDRLAKIDLSTVKSYPSVRNIAINNGYIVISDKGRNDTGEKVFIYRINEDDTVNLVDELQADNPDADGGFGNQIAVAGSYIAIVEEEGHKTYIFHQEPDNTFSKVTTLIPEDADPDRFYRIDLDMDQNYLVIGSERLEKVFLYTFDNGQIDSELQILPDSDDIDFGSRVSLSNNILLVGSDEGISVYPLDNDPVQPLCTIDIEDVRDFGFYLDIQGDQFVTTGYVSESLFVYDIEPLHCIYIYSTPSMPLEIYEGAPYTIYQVNAGSPDGDLAYDLAGEDAGFFELNKTRLSQITDLDFEFPADFDGDNDYQLSIGLTDILDQTESFPLNVRVTDRDYLLNTSVQADDAASDTRLGLALAAEGGLVVAGAQAGAYLFERDGEAGLKQVTKILPETDPVDDSFGSSVAVNENYILVGAPLENSTEQYTGAAYLYLKNGNELPVLKQRISLDGLPMYSRFGAAVALQGNTAAISAPGRSHSLWEPGDVYLYKIETDHSVTLTDQFKAGDAYILDLFGSSIDMNESYMIIGAPGHSMDGIADVGAAYLFKREADGTVTEVAMFQPETPEYRQSFGSAVSISGDYFIVGSSRDDAGGSVYVYKIGDSGLNADLVAHLTSTENNQSGASLDIRGTDILVGSYSLYNGRIYHYRIGTDDTVTCREIIRSVEDEFVDYFGFSVVFGNDYIASGTPYVDSVDTRSGTLYLFDEDT